jgi:hypothetical protein
VRSRHHFVCTTAVVNHFTRISVITVQALITAGANNPNNDVIVAVS